MNGEEMTAAAAEIQFQFDYPRRAAKLYLNQTPEYNVMGFVVTRAFRWDRRSVRC